MNWTPLFILAFVGKLALADCGTVDLRACMGPPRDQGETGWCFATTTADLATCSLGVRVSSTDIALTYHLAPPDFLEKNRFVSEEIRRNAELNLRFLEWGGRKFPFRDSLLIRKNGKLPEYKGLYETGGEEDLAFLFSLERGFCADAELQSGPGFDVKNIKDVARLFRTDFPVPPGLSFNHIPLESRRVSQAFWIWSDRRCKRRIHSERNFFPRSYSIAEDSVALLELKKNEAKFQAKRAELISIIDDHLSHGRAVASGIDTRDMTTEEWSGGDPEHSIIFAARKQVNGVCHYFVRNTAGTDCSIYLNKLNPTKKCVPKAGGIWITLDQIPSLYSATALERVETPSRRKP